MASLQVVQVVSRVTSELVGTRVVELLVSGPQGVPGPQGEQGETGDTGPAGVVAADLPLTYDGDTQTVGSDGSLLVTVAYGTAVGTVRPSYAATVYWKGSAAPENGADGDLWYDTTGDA